MLGVGLLLTVGTGLFVASEFALVNLDRADLEARRAAGETRLSLTINALRITSTHLSSAQLGITLTTLLTGYTMEPALSNLLDPVFESWGVPEAASRPISTIVAMATATIFSMIIGELVPKNFALAVPRQTAKLVMGFQTVFTTVFRPAIQLLNGSANAVLRGMGVEPKEELSGARTAEELSSLVRRSASAGVLEKDTASLLDRTLTFSRLTTADVMTPARASTRSPPTTASKTSCSSPVAPATAGSPSSASRWTTSPASCTSSRPSPCRASAEPMCPPRRSPKSRCACPKRSTSTA